MSVLTETSVTVTSPWKNHPWDVIRGDREELTSELDRIFAASHFNEMELVRAYIWPDTQESVRKFIMHVLARRFYARN